MGFRLWRGFSMTCRLEKKKKYEFIPRGCASCRNGGPNVFNSTNKCLALRSIPERGSAPFQSTFFGPLWHIWRSFRRSALFLVPPPLHPQSSFPSFFGTVQCTPKIWKKIWKKTAKCASMHLSWYFVIQLRFWNASIHIQMKKRDDLNHFALKLYQFLYQSRNSVTLIHSNVNNSLIFGNRTANTPCKQNIKEWKTVINKDQVQMWKFLCPPL